MGKPSLKNLTKQTRIPKPLGGPGCTFWVPRGDASIQREGCDTSGHWPKNLGANFCAQIFWSEFFPGGFFPVLNACWSYFLRSEKTSSNFFNFGTITALQ